MDHCYVIIINILIFARGTGEYAKVTPVAAFTNMDQP